MSRPLFIAWMATLLLSVVTSVVVCAGLLSLRDRLLEQVITPRPELIR